MLERSHLRTFSCKLITIKFVLHMDFIKFVLHIDFYTKNQLYTDHISFIDKLLETR